jgi:hypothetical protein
LGNPVNGKVEIAGPERFEIFEIVERYLQHVNDPRKVIANSRPEYFGGEVSQTALVPTGQAELGTINFEKWCSDQLQVQ